MAKFSDALDRSMDDIKRPPPLPVGNYTFRITKVPGEAVEIQGKPYERLDFPVAAIAALDDVDADELEAFGKVEGAPSRVSFLFNTDPAEERSFENTLNDVKAFLDKCGVEGGTLKERIARSANAQFIGEISHRQDPNNAENVFAEIKKTAAL